MTDEDYAFNLQQVKDALIEKAKEYPLLPGLLYTSAYDFVAQHGKDYRPTSWQFQYAQGAKAQCFGNAISLAGKYGLKYVEGFALSPFGEGIVHGWNAGPDGELVDSTWCNTGLIYIGVEFSLERGDDATWNGDAHVLNDENRDYPIFKKIWQGEDYSIAWPQSDRVDALRRYRVTGYYEEPASVTAWLKEQGQ